ncbi:MAG: hypothetical protein ACREXK_10270, partial [Gammaproteobacteria bacterium]
DLIRGIRRDGDHRKDDGLFILTSHGFVLLHIGRHDWRSAKKHRYKREFNPRFDSIWHSQTFLMHWYWLANPKEWLAGL